MTSHATSVISLQKYCHNWPVPNFRAGWHSVFHAFLSHCALVRAPSLDASFGKVLLQILRQSRERTSLLWIGLHHSGLSETCQAYTLAVRLTPEVPVPYSEMASVSYICSAVIFWDASSLVVWTTDADVNVRHSPNMRSHSQARTTHACSPEKPQEASPIKQSIWAILTKIPNKLVSRHFPSTASWCRYKLRRIWAR